MRIEKWVFLLSYAIFLLFDIFFSLFSKDSGSINIMIFAITIASTCFSFSDLFYTLYNDNRKVRKALLRLFKLEDKAENHYRKIIETKYNQQAKNLVEQLNIIFKDDEEMLFRFFTGNLSTKEKEIFLDRVKRQSGDELVTVVTDFLELDNLEELETVSGISEQDRDIGDFLCAQKKKETMLHNISSVWALAGLTALLIILTIRIEPLPYICNISTIVAFLSVIVNVLLKEYYNANLRKEIAKQTVEVIKDLIENDKN